MNRIALIVFFAIVLVCAALADDAKAMFKVQCPACLKDQTLVATSTMVTGTTSTNVNGVDGVMQATSAAFHCPECHTDFSLPVKPDKFVPKTVATPVLVPRPTAQRRPGVFNPPIADELVRTIQLQDGSEILVYHRKAKASEP